LPTAAEYARAEKAVATRRAYLADFEIFRAWWPRASLDELIAKLKGELEKLAPVIDLEVCGSRRDREPRAA
jgi:hypothetical protein